MLALRITELAQLLVFVIQCSICPTVAMHLDALSERQTEEDSLVIASCDLDLLHAQDMLQNKVDVHFLPAFDIVQVEHVCLIEDR